MSDQEKINMLAKALAPFADLLEYDYPNGEFFELCVHSDDVANAKKALKTLENK